MSDTKTVTSDQMCPVDQLKGEREILRREGKNLRVRKRINKWRLKGKVIVTRAN